MLFRRRFFTYLNINNKHGILKHLSNMFKKFWGTSNYLKGTTYIEVLVLKVSSF